MFNTKAKKGVSLVAVLLFMLIATIASTATYKWLSSESRSSSSRMEIVEAREASKAGIENARAWLSYNANDVGALIKQYIDGGSKNILLNTQLAGINNRKQNYSVWLTGVDISTPTFKLKLTSNGTSRDGSAKYSENAILKVNGLYQVSLPQQSAPSDYNDALFGSVESISLTLSSATINGDAAVNSSLPVEVKDHLIVTGDLYTCGTHIVNYNNLYVKGNLYAQAGFTADGSVYIGEKFTPAGTGIPDGYGVTVNNLYAEKGIDMNMLTFINKCNGESMVVGGVNAALHVLNNLTINDGNIKAIDNGNYWNGATARIITENNLVIKNGTLVFPPMGSYGNTEQYIAKHHTYIKNGATGLHRNFPQNVSFGTDENDFVDLGTLPFVKYDENNKYYGNNEHTEPNPWNPWAPPTTEYDAKIQILGKYPSSISSTAEYEADNMYDLYGKDIVTESTPGCGNTPHVPDPISFNPELLEESNPYLHHAGNKGKCKGSRYDLTLWGSPQDNRLWEWLESCYEEEGSDKLYKGEWLLIKLSGKRHIVKDYPEGLKHKYIIISDFDADIGNGWTLAPTKEGAKVFLYFNKKTDVAISENSSVNDTYNYFFFGKTDINYNNNKMRKLTGSIFMSDCAKIESSNLIDVDFDKNYVDELNQAGILCPKAGCNSTTVDDPDDSDSSPYGTGKDHYFISTSPQLDISLESQSKNTEDLIDENDASKTSQLEPSVLVLPRVTYITTNPVGRLSDYYSIVNLNHADEVKDPSKVTCNPTLPVNSPLYTDGHYLTDNAYHKCTYESKYGDVPFWVIVSGKTGEIPYIGLVNDHVEIKGGETGTTVTMHVDEATRGGDMSVIIRVSEIPEKWTITKRSDKITPITISSVNPNERYYKVSFSTEGNIPLFDVSAEDGATSKTVVFELMPGTNEGCNLGNFKIETISIPGRASVQRNDIPETECSDNETLTTTSGHTVNCLEFVHRDDCTLEMQQNDIWIVPSCMSPTTEEGKDNTLWTCNTNLPIKLVAYPASAYCDIVVKDETIDDPQGDRDSPYELHASLKRKPFNVTIEVNGATGITTTVTRAFGTATPETAHCDVIEGTKTCQVYAGDHIQITKNDAGNDFNQWKCLSGDCMDMPSRTDAIFEMTVTQNSDVQLTYNRRDEHCFYESFDSDRKNESTKEYESFKIFCPSEGYRNCIDVPADYAGSSCTDCDGWTLENSLGVYEGSTPSAVWAMMHWTTRNTSSWGKYQNDVYNKLDNENGALSVSSKHDKPTVLLNTVNAGANGQFTLTAKIPLRLGGFAATSSTNDGIILRSNSDASDYLLVTMIRESLEAGVALYHVVNGTKTKIDDSKFSGLIQNIVDIFRNIETITLQASIKDNSLKVEAYYNQGNGTALYGGAAEFDLTSVAYMADKKVYKRVGISIYDAGTLATSKYSYFSAAWNSYDYAGDCWDTPQIYCSFANNHLGGVVPVNENVTPWFGYGNWFATRGCTDIKFYYNGCDLDRSLYKDGKEGNNCSSFNPEGNPYNKGTELSGAEFNFSDKSPHGIPVNTLTRHGYKKSASAEISCKGETYSVNCGTFVVGEIEKCTENIDLFNGSKTSDNSTIEIDFNSDSQIPTANLRDAKISIKIEMLSDGEIFLKLIDDANTESATTPQPITSTGVYEIDVKVLAEKVGFNPQKVKKIKFSGTGSYKVLSILSSCSNVLSINNCQADIVGSKFRITYDVENPIAADKNGCTLESDFGSISENCPITGKGMFEQSIPDDFYSSFGGQTSKTIEFEVSAQDKSGKKISCSPQPSITISQPELDCSIEKTSIFKGEELPLFRYAISNCTGDLCKATVSIDNETPKPITYGKWCSDISRCTQDTWTPNVSLAEGQHTYKITHSTLGSCQKSFNIQETVAAKASGCRVEEGVDGKEFRADITVPNYGTSILKLYYTDPIGNPVGDEVPISASDETTIFIQSLKDLQDGNYRLALFINDELACPVVPYNANSKPDITVGSCSDFEKNAADDHIEITLGNVQGCEASKCSWIVTPSVNQDGQSFEGSKIGFYDVNASSSKKYSVVLSRDGYNSSSPCEFNVAVKAIEPATNCEKYCSGGCDDLQKGTFVKEPNDQIACIFATSISEINGNYGRNTIKVNNKNFTTYCGNENDCKQMLSNSGVSKNEDGGYYIEVPITKGCSKYAPGAPDNNCQWIRITSTTNGTIPSAPSTGGNETTNSVTTEVAGGEEQLFDIESGSYTLNHSCRDNGGWWYTCTGTSLTINGSTYACGGTQYSTWTQPPSGTQLTYEPPPTGSTLEIPSGTKLNKFGCAK